MSKKLDYSVKNQVIQLSGTCFWFWNTFYDFLTSCGVPKHIQERFPKETYNKYSAMRNILNHYESIENYEIPKNIVSGFYKMKGAVDKDNLDDNKAKKLLAEFKEMIGNDPIEDVIRARKVAKRKAEYQTSMDKVNKKNSRMSDLNGRFLNLHTDQSVTPQKRGFLLETLFFDLLQLSEFEYNSSYKTTDGEQIDGHFQFEKFDYLIECKWEKDTIKQKDLSIFDGKIRGKAQSTRGLFISANGFDENAINKFSGDSPRIILLTGQDLALIFSGSFSLYDALKYKVDSIVRHGKILQPLGSKLVC